MAKRKGTSNAILPMDRRLGPRIQEYLDVQDDVQMVSLQMVVEYLRDRYPEYARNKKMPFSRTVETLLRDMIPEVEDKMEEEEQEPEVSASLNTMNDKIVQRYVSSHQTAPKTKETKTRTKKQRTSSAQSYVQEEPTARYADIGGLQDALREFRELVEPALLHPELFQHLGVSSPTGVLLYGPSGTGKTLMAHALAGELSESGVTFLKVAAPEIVSGMSGESEAKLRNLFQEAQDMAPAVILFDEVDAITPKRETAGREMERRIVSQLLSCMDSLATNEAPVIVVGTTNRKDALDSSLRRAGRFDREIQVSIPDLEGREKILRVMSSRMRLEGDFDFTKIAQSTAGYVGADIAALTREAAGAAIRRAYASIQSMFPVEGSMDKPQTTPLTEKDLEPLRVRMEDFEVSLSIVQPSSRREGFATIPDVSWNDVGALDELHKELYMSVVLPIKSPEFFSQVGLSAPAGVLLFGPPGNGKTLVAKAIANESGASFISIKGPELLNKFVGESERAVRQVFTRARASAPSIIFFDELDAICPMRGSGKSDSVVERVVNQLLTELDGLDSRKQVFVVAATNRPDIIDPAMLRPGRLDKLMYVPLPTQLGRYSILKTHIEARGMPVSPLVDIRALAADPRCEGYSGADLASLLREAAVSALEETLEQGKENAEHTIVDVRHFETALGKVFPSVSEKQKRRYDQMHAVLCRSRSIVDPTRESTES